MKGEMPSELENAVELPLIFIEVWNAFIALSNTRQYGMAANPFTYQEIQAYLTVTKTRLSGFEIDLLKRLDLLDLNAKNKAKKG